MLRGAADMTDEERARILELLAREGREKFQKMYGPLLQTDLTPEEGYVWLKDPWPWEEGGNT